VAGRAAARRAQLFVLTLFAAFTILAIAYNSDYTHLAITAPVWLLVVADTLESVFRRVESRGRAFRHAGALACVALLATLAVRMYRNPDSRRQFFPYPHETRFGRVDFMDEDEIAVVDMLTRLLDESPSKAMFAFPAHASLYLLVGGVNATPYQLLLENYSSPDHWTKTIDILEREKVPFVVMTRIFVNVKVDPLALYLADHYERIKVPRKKPIAVYFLYRRKPDAATDPLVPREISRSGLPSDEEHLLAEDPPGDRQAQIEPHQGGRLRQRALRRVG